MLNCDGCGCLLHKYEIMYNIVDGNTYCSECMEQWDTPDADDYTNDEEDEEWV